MKHGECLDGNIEAFRDHHQGHGFKGGMGMCQCLNTDIGF